MRVLVVDDDPLVARSLARLLKLKGHVVVQVASAAEARTQLASEPFDAVLSDLGLDGVESGDQLLDWVRAEHPHLKRVLTSGGSKPTSFIEVPPMDVFLPKPFDFARIDEVLPPEK